MTQELTGPQVLMMVSASDNELQRPADAPVSFYAKVRKMRKDPTVNLARALAIAPIMAAQWSYEQENDAPVGCQEFIARQIAPLRNHILRTAFFGCIDYGWASYEKIFEVRDDNMVYLRKLKPLLQDMTDILVDPDNGSFIGLRQDEHHNPNKHNEPICLSVDKCLLVNIDVEGGNLYGESVMSCVEMPYDQWCESNKNSARYDRKIAGSHWIVHYPMGTSPGPDGTSIDNFVIAKGIIQTLESAGAVAVPRSIAEHVESLNADSPDAWKIELLSDTVGQTAFMERMRYLDTLKVRAFGLPERAVLEGQFGTKAEAEAHADIAVLNMEMRHALVVQQLNWHLVNQLIRINYGPQYENKVYIQPAPIADLEKSFMRKLYEKIIADPSGFLMELESIDLEALRDRVGIPIKPATNIDATGVYGATAGTMPADDPTYDPTVEMTVWPTLQETTLSDSMVSLT